MFVDLNVGDEESLLLPVWIDSHCDLAIGKWSATLSVGVHYKLLTKAKRPQNDGVLKFRRVFNVNRKFYNFDLESMHN